MSSISISKTASEKILKDREVHSQLLGRIVTPYLLYYHRSYSTLNEGRIIEHGSGLTLTFIDHYDQSDDHYLSIDLGSNCTLVVGPSTFFQAGAHFIDWVDQKFKLTSVATKQCTDIQGNRQTNLVLTLIPAMSQILTATLLATQGNRNRDG